MTSGAMVTPVVVMGTRGDLRKTRYPFFYFIRAIIIPSSPADYRLGMCEIQTINHFLFVQILLFLAYDFVVYSPFICFYFSLRFFILSLETLFSFNVA